MARTERILALDIGATSIKAAEFEYPPDGTVVLTSFCHKEYDQDLAEESRGIAIAGLLRQMVVEAGFTSRRAVISVSGQSAFTRFVKLPPVAEEESRVRQIVEFEARQNVPFPIEEVIWDYQLMADPEADEMEVMFVVIKNEIVEQITNAVQAVGLDPVFVDVAPAACFNAARANHVGDEECSMVLNIGGRSTNLLFADKQRFFARTIPIAGHSITQQIAKEFNIGMEEAEELKRRHGFVALGGAYEEPESEVAAAVSKIVRNVMARLHGEINRSISVYRAQQKGNRPTRLFLTGGSSIMAFTDHFFAEKLRMEVAYLNPFQVISLGPAVNRTQLQEVAHMFSEVVGLGLRYKVQCPVEVTLVPETIRRQQIFRQKKPYIFACLVCLLVMLFVVLLANQRKANLYAHERDKMAGAIENLDRLHKQIKDEQDAASRSVTQYGSLKSFFEERPRWVDILNEVQKLKPDDVWVVKLQPIQGDVTEESDVTSGGGGRATGIMGMGGGGGMSSSGMGMDMGMSMGSTAEGSGSTAPAFSGGGGGGGDDESGTRGAADVPKYGGLEIQGHSVAPQAVISDRGGDEPGGEVPKPEGGVAPTDPTKAAGPEATPADGDAAKKAGDAAEAEDAAKTGDAAEAEDAAKTGDAAKTDDAKAAAASSDPLDKSDVEMPANATPELVFLANLRRSPMFDKDPKLTRIDRESFQMSEVVRNLNSFTIIAKFQTPLEGITY